MSYWDALILAVVEGLTEFLPISSTGHIIIASALLGVAPTLFLKTFTVAIQLGAIVSVIILYWKNFFKSFNFYKKLLVAFIPSGIVGFLLSSYIDLLFENIFIISLMLVIGGIIFLRIDAWINKNETNPIDTISNTKAFKIGLFQILALIPGVSRSAATIIGGLSQKLTKQQAAEFSFFLAVPTMLAATGYKLLSYYLKGNSFTSQEIGLLLTGNVVAFVVGLFAIKTFINYLTSHGFKLFGYYRITLGLTLLILYLLGIKLSVV